MGSLRIVSPGLLSSVQDLGRRGWSALGVAEGGAADQLSLRAGNRLVCNGDDAAAIEMTLTGGEFAFESDALMVLAGGAFQAAIRAASGAPRAVTPWTPTEVRAGESLAVGPIVGGARAYLCIAGGIKVEPALGSASTHLSAAFGGHEGRALRAGDSLALNDRGTDGSPRRVSSAVGRFVAESVGRRVLRALDGPRAHAFDRSARGEFWRAAFTVSGRSDRVGVRLEGAMIAAPGGGRMASEGMPWGAVQVTPSGEPIILSVDHPTTGGYPVIACVAAVDLPALGQLRSGERVSFERVTRDEAQRLVMERERRFDAEVSGA